MGQRFCVLPLVIWLAQVAGPGLADTPADLLRVPGESGRPGGSLSIALRAEPKTLNPVLAAAVPSFTVIHRLMADLVHIDRSTLKTTPALATSWEISPDGLQYTLELRRGVRFSDGQPFDADDVLFTFEVYLDPEIGSPHRDFLIVGGEPIKVEKRDSHTVVFRLAQPYAVGERLFDSIPILPRHRLLDTYREGRFDEAWGISTPAEEIVGLGPFKIERYLPGERLDLVRNPHYWKADSAGQRLPYLERLTFLFVPSEDAQTLRFLAGDTQLSDRLSAKSYATLQREQAKKGFVLEDLGPGLNYVFLFFNMNDLEAPARSEIMRKQKWFRKLEFRQAVSSAIDRDGIVRLVYQGRAEVATSHVSPGNKPWLNRRLPLPKRSLADSRELLRSAGFTWGDDGLLRDSDGDKVEFSILTSSSNQERREIATIIQDDLEQLGIAVRVVPLEFRAMVDRILRSHDYEASILAFGGGDMDPNSTIATVISTGQNHLWRLEARGDPPSWQAEIDALMKRQLTATDPVERKRLYDRVQQLSAENLPVIYLVSPNVLAGAASDLGNFSPTILDHFTLWNVDELYWRDDAEH